MQVQPSFWTWFFTKAKRLTKLRHTRYWRRPIASLMEDYLREVDTTRRLTTSSPSYQKLGDIMEKVAAIDRQLEQIASSSRPIVAGPWTSEVGFENLYWIPFLKWFQQHFQISLDRFIVFSRGGTREWYGDLANRYFDLFDYFSAEEFREWSQRHRELIGGQKQTRLTEFDEEILRRARLTEYELLHPSLMYGTFRYCWKGTFPLYHADVRTVASPMVIPASRSIDLPKEFVAVKFYFSQCFPETAENAEFCKRTVRELASKGPVVLLHTGLKIDDHGELLGEEIAQELPNVISAKSWMSLSDNLAVQSYVVSRAKLFVGTYGGFSYLGPFYGLPSICFYSERESFVRYHLDFMNGMISRLKEAFPGHRGEFVALNARLPLHISPFPGVSL